MTDSPPIAVPPTRGRPLLLLGIFLVVAGIVGYAIQIAAKNLFAPWYLPAAATVGVLLVVASFVRRRTLGRGIALGILLLVAGAEWTYLLHTRLPAYAGPLAVGKPFPPFQTLRADGTPFTQRDLPGNQDTAMVFFRGRW